ncbi:hypothetical protein [Kushneria aurantia]|uniref:Type II secretion system protein GspC N-terminal domain-containing protein n=1 Tax=Kushneria aurantia TaxID=504092 RepID=A0ABV6G543_9GAMM|nr:hypothetical protein [Kushneria aurantia]
MKTAALTNAFTHPAAWRWLGWCLLAWLAAHALSGVAQLVVQSDSPAATNTEVRLEPAWLPVVSSQWGSEVAGDETIPLTDLPWQVVGRALSAGGAASLVVLSTPDGQRALMVGDEIEAGISVAAIDAQGIVLSRHGRAERLPWPEPQAQDGAITPADNDMPPRSSSREP